MEVPLKLQIAIQARASQVAQVVNSPPANAEDVRDLGSIPGSGRSPGEGNGSPLQYSCLENPMDRGACRLQSIGRKELDTTEGTEHVLTSVFL